MAATAPPVVNTVVVASGAAVFAANAVRLNEAWNGRRIIIEHVREGPAVLLRRSTGAARGVCGVQDLSLRITASDQNENFLPRKKRNRLRKDSIIFFRLYILVYSIINHNIIYHKAPDERECKWHLNLRTHYCIVYGTAVLFTAKQISNPGRWTRVHVILM